MDADETQILNRQDAKYANTVGHVKGLRSHVAGHVKGLLPHVASRAADGLSDGLVEVSRVGGRERMKSEDISLAPRI
jgi:hypothetical protein